MTKLIQNQLEFFFRNICENEIEIAKKEITKIEKDYNSIFSPYKHEKKEFIFDNLKQLLNFRKGR